METGYTRAHQGSNPCAIWHQPRPIRRWQPRVGVHAGAYTRLDFNVGASNWPTTPDHGRDLTYDAHLLEEGHVPGVGDRSKLRKMTASVNILRNQHPGLVVLPAHDPGAARRLAQATG
jgi:hypothetical protein